jgi:aflatoxin B1 aldehyde reductase
MKIILGTMNIEYPWTSNPSNTIEEYKSIIDYYLQWSKSNLNNPILDTAYYYANTKTEQVLGQILPQLDYIPKIATKANPWFQNDFTSNQFGQLDKINLPRQLETSLLNLGLNKVDIFYLHCWDYETPIRETLEITTDLWRREKFDKFGISNFNPEQTNLVMEIIEEQELCPLSYYQGMYNMIAKKVEEILPIINLNKIEFWAYNPLAGGLLTGKYKKIYDVNNNNNITELDLINSRFGLNKIYQNIFWKEQILNGIRDFVNLPYPINYALNWYKLDSKLSFNDGIIIGSSTLEQIKTNLKYLNNDNNEIIDDNVYKDFNIKYDEFKSYTPDYFY